MNYVRKEFRSVLTQQNLNASMAQDQYSSVVQANKNMMPNGVDLLNNRYEEKG